MTACGPGPSIAYGMGKAAIRDTVVVVVEVDRLADLQRMPAAHTWLPFGAGEHRGADHPVPAAVAGVHDFASVHAAASIAAQPPPSWSVHMFR